MWKSLGGDIATEEIIPGAGQIMISLPDGHGKRPSGSNSQAGAAICTCNEGYLGPGRCGPLAGYSRCGGGGSTPEPDYAIYCNEENGWCGDTTTHRDAQPGNSYDFLANSGGCCWQEVEECE